MATAGTATRIDAERHLSDQEVSTRTVKASFEVEILADAWRDQTPGENITAAQAIIEDLERLASETAAQRPAIARTLRTAAHDLRRAQLTNDVSAAYIAVCDALQLLEGL